MNALTDAQASLLLKGTEYEKQRSDREVRQHDAAVTTPRGIEVAILALYTGLFEYAREYEREIGAHIGDDGYGCDPFAAIASALIALLNLPTGRFDCGTISRVVRNLCHEYQVSLEP